MILSEIDKSVLNDKFLENRDYTLDIRRKIEDKRL